MNPTGRTTDPAPPVPLLFRNAVPRTRGQELPGQFDEELSVWTLGTDDYRVPIVEANNLNLLETATKTAAQQETDDEDFPKPGERRGITHLTEIETKTRVNGEADDEFPSRAAFAELETKTFVQTESDDDANIMALLELETKTEAQVEHDDQSRPLL
jgi:hypothetical protein